SHNFKRTCAPTQRPLRQRRAPSRPSSAKSRTMPSFQSLFLALLHAASPFLGQLMFWNETSTRSRATANPAHVLILLIVVHPQPRGTMFQFVIGCDHEHQYFPKDCVCWQSLTLRGSHLV